MTATIAPSTDGTLARLVREQKAALYLYLHPGLLSNSEFHEVEEGSTLGETLRGLGCDTEDWLGWVVRRNSETIDPEDCDGLVLHAGDRLAVRSIPREPVSITAFFVAMGNAISAGFATGATAGAIGTTASTAVATASTAGTIAAGAGAAGFTAGAAGALGGAAGLAGFLSTSGLFQLVALTAISVGSSLLRSTPSGPDGLGPGTTRVNPHAAGVGNDLQPDSPVYIPCGDLRVTPPHIAMPFQLGFAGGDAQDPSRRALLGVAGDCLISDLLLGETEIGLLDIDTATFRAQKTVDFPTAVTKQPGITLKDEWQGNDPPGEDRWEYTAFDEEVNEISLTWLMGAGLYRIDEQGDQEIWQIAHETEYREIGTSTWYGFYRRDGSGNVGQCRVPFVFSSKRTDSLVILVGRTQEPFFWYATRRVPKAQYEIRFRLRNEKLFLRVDGSNTVSGKKKKKVNNEDRQKKNLLQTHWPKDRWGKDPNETPGIPPKGNTDTSTLGTDPQLVELLGLIDGPAVRNCPINLSGIDITLHDQAAKSDDSSRVSARIRRQIPDLSGPGPGAAYRGAPTTTRNPVAICLDLLTGETAGDTAIPDEQIDWDAFKAASDYCDQQVPKIGGGTEALHEMDAVIARAGVGREEQVFEILMSFRMKFVALQGKRSIVIDEKKTTPAFLFADSDILAYTTDRAYDVFPHAYRVEFENREDNGKREELTSYLDSPPVPGKLPNGGYAPWTASRASEAVTVARSGPSSEYADITINAGTWSDTPGFPEDGWLCISWDGASGPNWGFATSGDQKRLFAIDEIDSTETLLRVIDPNSEISTGAQTGNFDTTVASRIERLPLPYQQRASECWREAQYRHNQRLRPAVHDIHVGLEWIGVARGDMIEVNSSVPSFGNGSGRVIELEGPATAATGVRMDAEYEDVLSGSFPVIKFVTWNGSSIVVNRYDIDIALTTTLRAGKPADEAAEWLAFDAAYDLDAIGLKVGDGNGSVGAYGEKTFESRELIVMEVIPGQNVFTATLRCVDHAPTMFDSILDQTVTPKYNAGITETLTGGVKPAPPLISSTVDSVSSSMKQHDLYLPPSSFVQRYERLVGSFISDGFTDKHKVTVTGFGDPNNDVVRKAIVGFNEPAPGGGTSGFTVGAIGPTRTDIGNGDEYVYAVIGNEATTLHIDRYATGLNQLDFTVTAPGVAEITDPNAGAVFASFRKDGFVYFDGSSETLNHGWFEIDPGGAHTDDKLVLQNVPSKAVTSVGQGTERCHQSQVFRPSGDFVADDGFSVNDRVQLAGFERDLTHPIFTVRGASANALYLEDPFAQLGTETGSGDETVTRVKVTYTSEVLVTSETLSELKVFITLPIRAAAKTLVTSETIEGRYRLRDRESGLVTSGWIPAPIVQSSAVGVKFGPIPSDSDFDFAARTFSRERVPSDWVVLTGNGGGDLPPSPTFLNVESDSIATSQGRRFGFRVEWDDPELSNVTVRSYLLRYSRDGSNHWNTLRVYDDTVAVVTENVSIGSYLFEIHTVDERGVLSEPLYEFYDYEPDRDWEDTHVLNLRLLNHAALPLGEVPIPPAEPTEDPPTQEQ